MAAWETWFIPRPQPIDPVISTDPSAWELDVHYLESFGQPTFPTGKHIPHFDGKGEGTLIGFLQPSKGNLWKLLYNTMNSTIQLYWKYAHRYSDQHSHTDAGYDTWEKFADDLNNQNLDEVPWVPPGELDPRFSCYSVETDLTTQLSRGDLLETTEAKEIAKSSSYSLNEHPTLEARIITEESLLGVRGKKRGGAEEDISAPPQKGKKGSKKEVLQSLQDLILQRQEKRPKQ